MGRYVIKIIKKNQNNLQESITNILTQYSMYRASRTCMVLYYIAEGDMLPDTRYASTSKNPRLEGLRPT